MATGIKVELITKEAEAHIVSFKKAINKLFKETKLCPAWTNTSNGRFRMKTFDERILICGSYLDKPAIVYHGNYFHKDLGQAKVMLDFESIMLRNDRFDVLAIFCDGDEDMDYITSRVDFNKYKDDREGLLMALAQVVVDRSKDKGERKKRKTSYGRRALDVVDVLGDKGTRDEVTLGDRLKMTSGLKMEFASFTKRTETQTVRNEKRGIDVTVKHYKRDFDYSDIVRVGFDSSGPQPGLAVPPPKRPRAVWPKSGWASFDAIVPSTPM